MVVGGGSALIQLIKESKVGKDAKRRQIVHAKQEESSH